MQGCYRSEETGMEKVREFDWSGKVGENAKLIRYDDTRCNFNVRSKADMSQLNLPHGTEN